MTGVLLDTHLLLWALIDPGRLSSESRDLLASRRNDVCFSVASIWEISIKYRRGGADFGVSPALIADRARQTEFRELDVSVAACLAVADMPLLHRDPFDRMLVAQAMTAPMFLLTVDRQLAAYSDLVRVVA